MKKYIFSLIILVFLGSFSSCQKYPATQCPCGKIEISKKESISMCILPEVVTATSVNTLRIENYTKKDMGYGATFYMEYFFEDNWVPIEWDLNFAAIHYILYAGNIKENQIYLYQFVEMYNESKAGKYRMIKPVGNYDLIAEFEIK